MRTRVEFFLLLLLAACAGGGSSSVTTTPQPQWGRFRGDNLNSSQATGSVAGNQGQPTLLHADFGTATGSSPAISADGTIYLGTQNGLIALAATGGVQWQFDRSVPCPRAVACPSDAPHIVGPISSSPAVSTEGDIVVGSDNDGYIFRLRDDGESVTCLWKFCPPITASDFNGSSPVLQVDPVDLTLISAFVGTSDGRLRALNGDGTEQWHFPGGAQQLSSLTSSPALSSTGILYVTFPDGFLHAIDLAGRSLWQFEIGVSHSGVPLLPSPAVSQVVYAVGANSMVWAINLDGTRKWSWRDENVARIAGSPTFTGEMIDENGLSKIETVVYVVDERGIVYGISDSTGAPLVLNRCSESREACTRDDCPGGETCIEEEGMEPHCSVSSDTICSPDSCPEGEVCEEQEAIAALSCPEGEGCVGREAAVAANAVEVRATPAISSDLFAVVGSDESLVCARKLDGTVPDGEAWSTGCITIDDHPVSSSPVIDDAGTIYVTTDGGLYAIQ